MGKTFWGVVSAAVEQSRRKASMVAQGDGKFGPWGWPQDPSKPKQKQTKKTRRPTDFKAPKLWKGRSVRLFFLAPILYISLYLFFRRYRHCCGLSRGERSMSVFSLFFYFLSCLPSPPKTVASLLRQSGRKYFLHSFCFLSQLLFFSFFLSCFFARERFKRIFSLTGAQSGSWADREENVPLSHSDLS